jgi:hypothetical protein
MWPGAPPPNRLGTSLSAHPLTTISLKERKVVPKFTRRPAVRVSVAKKRSTLGAILRIEQTRQAASLLGWLNSEHFQERVKRGAYL